MRKIYFLLIVFFLIHSVSGAQSKENLEQSGFAKKELSEYQKAAVDRFLRYVAIDTQSKDDVASIPSTPGQMELAKTLKKEAIEIGLSDVRMDSHGYVYTVLPANGVRNPEKIPTIGFISHIDTSSDVEETKIHPKVHENYQGGDITLSEKEGSKIEAAKNPCLKTCIGSAIITTDGTSLLGADDKSGVAEIMTAMEYLIKHPKIPHGTVKIAFTPDEEVDKGPAGFDLKGFCASFAYTVDGGEDGEINDETFNAASAIVSFHGKSSHPGSAKGAMVNCLFAAAHFLDIIPLEQRPENSDERQGFLYPYELNGGTEKVEVKMLIRDFESVQLETKKEFIRNLVKQTQKTFPQVKIDVAIEDTYKNMKTILASFPFVLSCAEEGMKRAEVTPKKMPIRGGTDGADFSFMGLPCANIFTGTHNEHSREEWIAANSIGKAVETIVNMVCICSEKPEFFGTSGSN
ncbi:MAG: peptidase T [Candidatus Riflebacteria bacterium]|nr:peptidase T [Candidatus Riflebacteria bacterium]